MNYSASSYSLFLVCLLFGFGGTSLSIAADDTPAPVRVIKDVAYASEATGYAAELCKLDIYLPEGKADFPVLLYIHGGSLRRGAKDDTDTRAVGMRLAKQGIGVVIPNYRLDPTVGFPTYIEDIAAAVAWTKGHMRQHGGHPDQLFVSGHSAGGYLAAMVTVDPRYLAPHGLSAKDISGFIPISGQMYVHTTVLEQRGLPASSMIIDEAAPLYYCEKDLPPALFITGEKDLPGRSDQSRDMAQALLNKGHSNVTFKEIPGRDHSTIVNLFSREDDAVAFLVLSFINELIQSR